MLFAAQMVPSLVEFSGDSILAAAIEEQVNLSTGLASYFSKLSVGDALGFFATEESPNLKRLNLSLLPGGLVMEPMQSVTLKIKEEKQVTEEDVYIIIVRGPAELLKNYEKTEFCKMVQYAMRGILAVSVFVLYEHKKQEQIPTKDSPYFKKDQASQTLTSEHGTTKLEKISSQCSRSTVTTSAVIGPV